MGSGGERFALALALRHGISALGDGAREPRHSGGVEPVAHLRGFQPDYSRHFFDPFRSAGLGAFLHRVSNRSRSARVLRLQLRGVRGASGLAGRKHQGRQTAAVGFQPHRVAHRQQLRVRGFYARGAAGHDVSAVVGGSDWRSGVGRRALFQSDDDTSGAAAAVSDGGFPDAALGQDEHRRA